jgi:hypothetical protein
VPDDPAVPTLSALRFTLMVIAVPDTDEGAASSEELKSSPDRGGERSEPG